MSGLAANGNGAEEVITGAKGHGNITGRVVHGIPGTGKMVAGDIDGIRATGSSRLIKVLLKRIVPAEPGLFQLKAINICYYCSYFFSGNYHLHRFCYHQYYQCVLRGV